MRWHHKDTVSGDLGTGDHQALGNTGIKRYFWVTGSRPLGGFSPEPLHLTVSLPGTRFSVSRAGFSCDVTSEIPNPCCSQALWASFSSGALGPHSRFSSVPCTPIWNIRAFGCLSTAATSEPDRWLPGGNQVDTCERINACGKAQGCQRQALRVCSAHLCRSPLSGTRMGMVSRGVPCTACTTAHGGPEFFLVPASSSSTVAALASSPPLDPASFPFSNDVPHFFRIVDFRCPRE